MTPAAGTRLFFIGDEGVLFSAPRQELHAFNTTACIIWCHLEEGLSPPAIAQALADASGLDAAVARVHVDRAITDWTARGLLADAPPPPLAVPRTNPAPNLPPLPDAAAFAETRHYRMLGVTVRIRFVRATDADLIDPLFAHLADGGTEMPDITADIAPVLGGTGCYLDGAPWAFCASSEEIALSTKAMVWTEVLSRQDYLIQIHAGVVGGPAGCVLLPAAPGGGKSTLTTALVHMGFDLFSDEVGLLAKDLTVSPFPMAICVKLSGIDIIAGMYPIVRELPIHLRPDGKRVVYMPPPAGSVPPHGHNRGVAAVVFPRYRRGAALSARRLPPAEALARLLTHCLNVGRTLDDEGVGALVRWIGAVPCHEIEYGSLEPVREMVAAMLGGDVA